VPPQIDHERLLPHARDSGGPRHGVQPRHPPADPPRILRRPGAVGWCTCFRVAPASGPHRDGSKPSPTSAASETGDNRRRGFISQSRAVRITRPSMTQTFYDVLGVPTDASTDRIRAAYRERLKASHPDLNDDDDANEVTRRVIRAQDVLTDEAERERYDEVGHEEFVGDDTSPVNDDDVSDAAAAARRAGWGDGTGDESSRSESGGRQDRTARSAAEQRQGARDRRRRERAAREQVDRESQRTAGATSGRGVRDRRDDGWRIEGCERRESRWRRGNSAVLERGGGFSVRQRHQTSQRRRLVPYGEVAHPPGRLDGPLSANALQRAVPAVPTPRQRHRRLLYHLSGRLPPVATRSRRGRFRHLEPAGPPRFRRSRPPADRSRRHRWPHRDVAAAPDSPSRRLCSFGPEDRTYPGGRPEIRTESDQFRVLRTRARATGRESGGSLQRPW